LLVYGFTTGARPIKPQRAWLPSALPTHAV
jgi:hypothetical protein